MSNKGILTYENINKTGAIQNTETSGTIIIKCGNTEIARFSNGELVLIFGGGLKQTISYTPTGTIIPFAGLGTKLPDGYFFCNGDAKDKMQFKRLYDVIQNTYGSTSTTFNLPNLRTRIPIGSSSINSMMVPTIDASGNTTNSLIGGNKNMDINQLAIHEHDLSYNPLNYLVNRSQCSGTSGGATRAVSSNSQSFFNSTKPRGAGSDLFPPFTVVQYIIKY